MNNKLIHIQNPGMNVMNGMEHNPEAFQYLVGGSCSLAAALFFTSYSLVRCAGWVECIHGACTGPSFLFGSCSLTHVWVIHF